MANAAHKQIWNNFSLVSCIRDEDAGAKFWASSLPGTYFFPSSHTRRGFCPRGKQRICRKQKRQTWTKTTKWNQEFPISTRFAVVPWAGLVALPAFLCEKREKKNASSSSSHRDPGVTKNCYRIVVGRHSPSFTSNCGLRIFVGVGTIFTKQCITVNLSRKPRIPVTFSNPAPTSPPFFFPLQSSALS